MIAIAYPGTVKVITLALRLLALVGHRVVICVFVLASAS